MPASDPCYAGVDADHADADAADAWLDYGLGAGLDGYGHENVCVHHADADENGSGGEAFYEQY